MNIRPKRYKFFFHFNKPMSRTTGTVWWTVHFRGTCTQVQHINCQVPVKSKSNKRQPYAVIEGAADYVHIFNDTATIYNWSPNGY